jgi:hypothetical protein
VEASGSRFIATVRVDGGGATVVYCKTFLGGDEDRCLVRRGSSAVGYMCNKEQSIPFALHMSPSP